MNVSTDIANDSSDAGHSGSNETDSRARIEKPPAHSTDKDASNTLTTTAKTESVSNSDEYTYKRDETDGATRYIPEESEPILPELVSRVKAISLSNTELRKELKAISHAFAANKKTLESVEGIEESLAAVLIQMQQQSGQIAGLKKEAEGFLAGLDEASTQSEAIYRLEERLGGMQEQIAKAIQTYDRPSRADTISEKVGDDIKAMMGASSESITKLAQAVDATRQEIRMVAARSASATGTGIEIDALKSEIAKIADSARHATVVPADMRESLESLAAKVKAVSDRSAIDLGEIRREIDGIDSLKARIANAKQAIDTLGERIDGVLSSAESARAESDRFVRGRLEQVTSEMASLAQRADSTAAIGEHLKAVQKDVAALKSDTTDRMQDMGIAISRVSDTLERQEADTAEIYRETKKIHSEMADAKVAIDATARKSARESLRLLRLSEYQSAIRMSAESGYGDLATIEAMAKRTAEIARMFENESVKMDHGRQEADSENAPHDTKNGLPPDVKRWAVNTILDCADRWEIRFTDLYVAMTRIMGSEMIRESVRLEQVRDIYGGRMADRLRNDLSMN